MLNFLRGPHDRPLRCPLSPPGGLPAKEAPQYHPCITGVKARHDR
ncbi:hypothetical protein JO379_000300 [Streptomyces syringium]|uniref:Uncharacterized protein n=1 Tax=Streptomyces syringium TaxID=76729 RepID=A0ABS4XWE8_9ACTN|nr:hypothetical protein [Streptomyces syringium]